MTSMTKKETDARRVAVIGGGAAGMMAALKASEMGADVTLFERNDRLGKKLRITVISMNFLQTFPPIRAFCTRRFPDFLRGTPWICLRERVFL